jgi:trimeric autotransporter adhesin
MRLLPAGLLALFASCPTFCQIYTISTFAGGGLPVNKPGTTASLYGALAQVAVDKTGNLFFSDGSVVLRLDATTGVLTLVAGNGTTGFSGDNGPATSAQLSGPEGVALDSAGNLYIADSTNNRIRKVSNGVISTVAGNGTPGFGGDNGPATNAQLNLPWGVAVDSSGNFYIADWQNNRIREVSNGVITTVAGNGTAGFSGDNGLATSAQVNGPRNVAVDATGNLYIADEANNRVRRVSNGVISTVAGNGTRGFSGDNGQATSAELVPLGMAFDSAGNLLIADNARIREVSNGVITTVAGNGTGNFSGDNGPATGAGFDSYGVAVDSFGNLYIADSFFNYRIRKVSNGVITTVAGNGVQGFSGDKGPATSAQLNGPRNVAVDSVGNLYIADDFNYRIRKVSNGVITTVAGNGVQGFSGDNGPATSAQLGFYTGGVAVDSLGNLYIADNFNNRIRKVSNGVITTVAGNGSSGFSGDNGPATSAQLSGPVGIALDSAGNLYIADSNNNRIRKVSNGVITTVAGNGSPGFSGDNGPATSAQLRSPAGIALDSAGNLYIADSNNNRIREVSNGVITTVAGNGTAGFSGDNGPATGAGFDPSDVAVDSAGNMYVADAFNNRIREVSNGVITTIAGGGTTFGDNGPATSAQLSLPVGVAVDSAGNVYIADSTNNRIRLLTPAASSCSYSVSPTSLQPSASGGNLSVSIQTAGGSCGWIISGLPGWITISGASSGTGSASVTLVVAANTGLPRSAQISIAGISVTVTQASNVLLVSPNGVINAASFTAPVAPGSIAAIFGNFLLAAPIQVSAFPIPTVLGGLSFQFGGGFSPPLFYANYGQVNGQVPWELAGRNQTTINATNGLQTSTSQTVMLATYSPGIFAINGGGTGQGAILDPNYHLVGSTNPATAGTSVVQIYCTGLGPVSNQPATGAPSPSSPLAETPTKPVVMIGGAPATVQFSGLTPGEVGLYQVNALVPLGSAKGTAVPVVISIGGLQSNTVTMAVQ